MVTRFIGVITFFKKFVIGLGESQDGAWFTAQGIAGVITF